ncbi:MAG: hypothetical protein HUK40_17320 [Desulfobacter sp.]|nr:hypothetical protein [Desulfobacter sp.]
MQYKLLVSGFLSAILLMAIIGIYALSLNQQTIMSFEDGEKNFKSISTAATEVSSYAKRAEGHLLLFLGLHRKTDKDKFPMRLASLYERISILDQKIKNPQARIIFEKIESNSDGILSMGNALIEYCDTALENGDTFEIEKHRTALFELHDKFSAIREFGVTLTAFEIELESDLKLKLKKNAERLRRHLLLLITLIFGLTVFLGYLLNKTIKTLNKEIAKRIQSETEVIQESNKLKDALGKVKELSGLLPICAACKKIRDDKGYWKQIESYISDHSDAEFSHSICPECCKKLYPEIYTKGHF